IAVGATFDLAGFSQQVGSVTGPGTVTDKSAVAATFTVGNAVTDTFAGLIIDRSAITTTGKLSLAKTGAGTLTRRTANTDAGSASVTGGTLADGAPNALPVGTVLSVSGATFDLNRFGQTVASVTGTGTVTNNSATAATFTVSNAVADTFAGI